MAGNQDFGNWEVAWECDGLNGGKRVGVAARKSNSMGLRFGTSLLGQNLGHPAHYKQRVIPNSWEDWWKFINCNVLGRAGI